MEWHDLYQERKLAVSVGSDLVGPDGTLIISDLDENTSDSVTVKITNIGDDFGSFSWSASGDVTGTTSGTYGPLTSGASASISLTRTAIDGQANGSATVTIDDGATFTLTWGVTSEPSDLLLAVQDILMACGRGRPSTLPTSGEGVHTVECIRAIERKVWRERWEFLMAYDVSLDPQPGGEVILPRGTRLAAGQEYFRIEGGVLYSVRGKSNQFNSTVRVDLIEDKPFERMPYYAQQMVTARAAAMYHRSYVPAHENREWALRQQTLELEAMTATGDANAEDGRVLPTNMMDTNLGRRVRGRSRYRRTPRAS